MHQVEEIEICGHVHTRSMWMVERDLKALKYCVKRRSCPKGSMIEGYMVYQSMLDISEYNPQVALPHINVPHIWYVYSKIKYEGKFLLRNGRMRKFKGNQIVIDQII